MRRYDILKGDSTPDSDNGTAPRTDNDDVARIAGGFDDDGTPCARAVLTPNEDQRTKEILIDHRPAIPVIFLPGVMGTLLSDKTTGKPVWSPPNLDAVGSGIVGVASVLAGWPACATKRAKRFDPDQAVVDPRGPIKLGNSGLTEEEARRRGWGALHRWSYQSTLAWLDTRSTIPCWPAFPRENGPKGMQKASRLRLERCWAPTQPTTVVTDKAIRSMPTRRPSSHWPAIATAFTPSATTG
jgi:hypothetical protein